MGNIYELLITKNFEWGRGVVFKDSSVEFVWKLRKFKNNLDRKKSDVGSISNQVYPNHRYTNVFLDMSYAHREPVQNI